MESDDVDSEDATIFELLARIKAAATNEATLQAQLADTRSDLAGLIDQAVATGRVDRRAIDMFCGRDVRKPRGGARPHGPVRHTAEDSPVLSSADIARLAGVTRGAVSNWKSRYPHEFPEPIDTALPERYDRIAVLQFLARRGHEINQ